MKKYILFILISITVTNNAVSQTIIAQGTCGAQGDNLTWVLTSDSVLTISGVGEMKDFVSPFGGTPVNAQWYPYRQTTKTVIIKEGVTNIGYRAFVNSGLTSIIIPNSVTTIGVCAFLNSRNLKKIIFGNGVTTIRESAFQGCSSLTTVTIPNSVAYIADGAFHLCRNLTSVIIGNSVRTIGHGTFSSCRNLRSVTSHALIPPVLKSRVFQEVNMRRATLHVPKESIDLYRQAEGWRNFRRIVAIEN